MNSIASGFEKFISDIKVLPEDVRKKILDAEPSEDEMKEIDKFDLKRFSLFNLLCTATNTDYAYLKALDFQNEVTFVENEASKQLWKKIIKLITTKRYQPFLKREQLRTVDKQVKLTNAITSEKLKFFCQIIAQEARIIQIMEGKLDAEAHQTMTQKIALYTAASVDQLKQFLREESTKGPLSFAGQFYKLNSKAIENVQA